VVSYQTVAMKTLPLLLLALSFAIAPSLKAQIPVTPATPTEFKTRGISGGSNSGVGVVTRQPQQAKTITYHFTAVTPIRVWTNTEGKAMQARLLAWSAPKEGEKGPVEVIRQGRVRFLLEKTVKPIDYDLVKLSETDRTYIQKLADAARHENPKEVKTETKPVEEKEN
jgi:hypothetical protein